jgi:hypothetical protein
VVIVRVMRESPRAFTARTGAPPPTTDVRIASQALATTARPLADDEPCPTLFRDVGPQALQAFLDGKLARLEGPSSPCVFLRDASLPGFTGVVRELGVLVFLQPLQLGPWRSSQPGIWVSELGRMPPAETLGFVPRVESIAQVEAQLGDAADVAAMREALGGARYDEQVSEAKRALGQYLETWRHIERAATPWRMILAGNSEAERRAALAALAREGVSERDLSVPLFLLPAARRAELAATLSSLAGGS